MSNTPNSAAPLVSWCINDVKIGDRVVWFSPRVEGTVIDADYCAIQIRWEDGTTSIQRKADGFVGWGMVL